MTTNPASEAVEAMAKAIEGFVEKSPGGATFAELMQRVDGFSGAGDPDAQSLGSSYAIWWVGVSLLAAKATVKLLQERRICFESISALAYAYDGMVSEAAAGEWTTYNLRPGRFANAFAVNGVPMRLKPDEIKAAKRKNAREKKAGRATMTLLLEAATA